MYLKRETGYEMYPYVVIGGAVNSDNLFEGLNISVDNVESVDELRKTDLHNTPILFYLDRKSSASNSVLFGPQIICFIAI